jgi:ADP-ribosylglycohydrolase
MTANEFRTKPSPISQESLARALCALEGLSVGDAFGECFFGYPDTIEALIRRRAVPRPPWSYTDDTQMALSIVAVLGQDRRINQDHLARSFAQHYEWSRGYGAAMRGALMRIADGEPWQGVAPSLFAGQGSFGNGAAMRVAPVGAYFADNLEEVVANARLSAEVTHAHPEAAAGAIAVAVAAALATRLRGVPVRPTRSAFLDLVLPWVPEGEVRSRIHRARSLSASAPVQTAVGVLGNGTGVSAQDTVPFALWCAAGQLDDYAEAIWLTASGLGDVDTTCAMVGGIVVMSTGVEGIPPEWRQAREPLPNWHEVFS